MKNMFSVVFVLTYTVVLSGQITSTLNRLSDGTDEVWIRNNSPKTLVSFVVTVNQVPVNSTDSHAPFVMYFDPLIESSSKALQAGEERKIIERKIMIRGTGASGFSTGLRDVNPNGASSSSSSHTATSVNRRQGTHLLEDPIVTAGVFADGTTTGEATLLTWLALRRSNMLLAVETSLEALLDAGRHNIPRDRVIEQFEKMANFSNRWYLPPEQQVGIAVYLGIIGQLKSLPEGTTRRSLPAGCFCRKGSWVTEATAQCALDF